ncbi:MAG: ATP-binding cassette domain-containing protein, partial [Pygmaiobacter sp.]
GIIGRNGAGKSTLLKLIMGKLLPDAGEIIIGETVKIGYFSQECEEMDLSMRPIDYVKEESNAIETPEGTLSATQLLEKFLFFSDLQYTTIGRLSGGERRRLYLLRILMAAPNVLILDEPTNDLDIETLTILEDYLTTFAGAVLMVSHDRYFLDKIATRIFCFEEDTIYSTMGGYTDWLIQREVRGVPEKTEKPEKQKQTPVRERPKTLKFTFKEKNDYAVIDDEIAALEAKQGAIKAELARCASDFVRLQELGAEQELLKTALAEKMERWVYLNDLNERINAQT